MTVSYQYDVASSSTGGFFRLLWRWRGSIWKLLYKELILFVAVYMCIAFTYDFLMSDYYKRYYEHIVVFCSAFVEVIPLSFILGFYVSFTATRWWQQYTAIPWPDKLMNIIALYIPGNDVTSRVLRRTLMRYLNLTLVLVLRSISIPVKRRFPTKEHLVEAGFMSRPELEIYQSVPSHEFNTFWIPCTWFVNLLREAKSECRITDSGGIKLIMEEFNEFRSKCGLLWSYDWVSIPLVYTQVVTLSTQAFFLASLLGRQHINPAKDSPIKSHIYGEYYIPIFTMLQFILYMGLLKLGEQLINPFGDDDEDFELNWIIDRHLKVSFLGVDILNSDPPPLIKDNYFDEMDIKLPYTEAAVAHKVKTYRGSVAAFHVPTDKHGLVIPEFDDENEEDSDDDPSTIQSNREAIARNNSWSFFSQRKRKLSSSFDSFNSETMVETGLSESEMPELVQSNCSWPTFLQSESTNNNNLSTTNASKLSVWPMNAMNEKANEDTQGIRCNTNIQYQQQQSRESNNNANGQDGKSEKVMFKQSSYSTSDSSVVIPLGDCTDQWPTASSSPKMFRPRKHPLQVFSKDLANAPISVFNQILESNLQNRKNSNERSSLSSLSSRSERPIGPFKPYKSLIKCQRPVDPKLRIRPFRSKVTFSDDTKNDDNKLKINMNRFHYNYDSSSESNSSLMKSTEEAQGKTQRAIKNSRSGIFIEPNVIGNVNGELTFAETSKRRQSFDPSLYRNKPNIVEEVDKDNWLHYQSLPNIQEEDQQSNLLSTDNQTGLLDPKDQLKPISTSLEIHYQSPPASAPVIQIRTNPMANLPTNSATSIKPDLTKVSSGSSHRTSGSNITSSNYQPKSIASTGSGAKKHSFKRQKSQEIPDEDVKIRLSQPSTSQNIIKQSSEDSQASSNSSTKGGIMPPGILRKRKENLKQASTESDTGSYHTVKSLVMHSSIDSFTSAVSESTGAGAIAANNNANSNNNNNNSKNVTILLHQHSKNENQTPTIADNLLLSYSAIHESALVPKIVFSQSTPSVTSQSSDDQNSPKWDERYSEFSSVETVAENPRTIRRKDSIKRKPIITATTSAISTTTDTSTTKTITKSITKGINSANTSSSSKSPINR